MPMANRSYQHPHDFERLTRFLSQARTAVAHSHYLHVGDLTWQVFHMLAAYRPADLIQIWEDARGDILGFVLLFPPYGGFELQLRPQEPGTALAAELLEWAEQHLPASDRRSTLANNHDAARIALLGEQGYVPDGEWLYLERPLNDSLPHAHIPPGFVVRSLLDDQEAAARAIVLAAAFEAPPQPERYQQFMRAPGYARDLDIVAVAPNHRFAAFAMCWVDRDNQVGQFEPVGTAPEFRRQGLAQAVVAEGLRRMQQYGAKRAVVIAEAAEEAACELYASVGFRTQWSLCWYTKRSSA
jgi:mycothiol synthase